MTESLAVSSKFLVLFNQKSSIIAFWSPRKNHQKSHFWSPHTIVCRTCVIQSSDLAGEISCQQSVYYPRIEVGFVEF